MSINFNKISQEHFDSIEDPNKKLWSNIFIALVLVLATFFLTAIVPSFFYEVVSIEQRSMWPTLDGEINKVGLLKTKNVKRGDIVVIDVKNLNLGNDTEYIIKRVIGLEGDTVWIEYNEEIKEYRVYISRIVNGAYYEEMLEEPYIYEKMNGGIGQYTVSKGCIFVMGDNRNNSMDSRSPQIGELSIKKVLGKGVRLLTKTWSSKFIGIEFNWYKKERIKNPFSG